MLRCSFDFSRMSSLMRTLVVLTSTRSTFSNFRAAGSTRTRTVSLSKAGSLRSMCHFAAAAVALSTTTG
eukprot:11825477-Alexandrium_andersonii.AAC.1